MSKPGAKARMRFSVQRSSAAKRGIVWELTFEQWWKIWQDSGRYGERGPGGYVMARHWDVGPYSVGNVEIKLARDNLLDYHYRRMARHVRFNGGAAHKPSSPDILDVLIAEEEGDRLELDFRS